MAISTNDLRSGESDSDPNSSVVSPWLRGQYAPIHDELDETEFQVTGTLPGGLRGTFLRNGPNPAFPPANGYHLFDGDGMIHTLDLDGEGGVRYRNRWIRSKAFEAEQKAGRSLFGGLGGFRMPPPEIVAECGVIKNTANTHVVGHANRILALMEACPPTELTSDLDTVGEYTFGGALAGSMTAHPKIDPTSGEMVFFGSSPVPPYLRVHSAAADGTLTWSTEVDLPNPVMMHDFVMTPTRVLVFDLPAVYDIAALIDGSGPPVRWQPEHPARIGVLDRGAPGDSITWVDVDPFWVFHFLNAYDDGSAIVAYGCRADRLNAGFGPDDQAASAVPMLHRWRIDPVRGTVTEDQISEELGDFPRIDDRRAGFPTRYGYLGNAATTAGDEIEFDGVMKHDLKSGTTISATYGKGLSSGEPVFTHDPSRTDEDAGWILNWVTDLAAGESSMVILDAETLEEVASVRAPRRVPFGFHGSFLPSPD